MTVSTTSNKITYNGNNATTTFPFSFPGVSASDLQVYYTDASGNQTLLSPSVYSVVLNAPVSPNPTGVGGTVTYPLSGSPIATGTLLTIYRSLPLTQPTSLSGQGTLWQTVIESALDDLTMMIQQINEILGRQITAAVSDSAMSNLPPAAQRALQYLFFDSSGNPTTGPGGGSGAPVSAPMMPVVAAASLAAARSAMGLGNLAVENIGAALQDDGSGNLRPIFNVVAVAVSRAVTAADYLDKLKVTGPITLTLPRANTLWNGFGFWIENLVGGGNLTIAINASDAIENGSSGASYIIPVGFSGYISTNASASGTWYLELSPGLTASAPPPNNRKNLVINVATNTTVSASADYLVVSDGTYSYTISPNATIDFTTNGVNGLDTGAIDVSKDYHIWAIYNPITQQSGWLASLQSTANATFISHLPAGYSAYARYGCVKSTSASILYGTKQVDNITKYIVGLAGTTVRRTAISTAGVKIGGTGAAGLVGFNMLGNGAPAPSTAKLVRGTVACNDGGNTGVLLGTNNNYGSWTSQTNPPPIILSSSTISVMLSTQFALAPESSQYFWGMSAAPTFAAVFVEEWEDNI